MSTASLLSSSWSTKRRAIRLDLPASNPFGRGNPNHKAVVEQVEKEVQWFECLKEQLLCHKHRCMLFVDNPKYCVKLSDGSHFKIEVPQIIAWARDIVSFHVLSQSINTYEVLQVHRDGSTRCPPERFLLEMRADEVIDVEMNNSEVRTFICA